MAVGESQNPGHGGTPTETRWREAHAHEQSSAIQGPDSVQVVLVPPPIQNKQTGELRGAHPDLGRVSSAIVQGENLRWVVRREVENGDIIYGVSSPLAPTGGVTRMLPQTDSTKSMVYARIEETKHGVQGKHTNGFQEEPQRAGFNIHHLLGNYNGAFEVIIDAAPVPEEKQTELRQEARFALHDARETTGEDEAVASLERVSAELARAIGKGLVKQQVILGVPEGENLNVAAELMANSVMPNDEFATWRVAKDTSDNIIPYRNLEKALAASSTDEYREWNTYVSAGRLVDLLEYPSQGIPGVDITENEVFAVNRYTEPGVETITIGERLDNNFNSAGSLEIPRQGLQLHNMIIAASRKGKTSLLRHMIVQERLDDYRNGRHCPTLIVDLEKAGNYAHTLADMLASQGLPESWSTIHRIVPGAGGVRANFNILRFGEGGSPAEQIAIATTILSSGITNPEIKNFFVKYLSDALELAYRKMGWDPKANEALPLRPMGEPAFPDMNVVAAALDEVIDSKEFSEATERDVTGVSRGELERALRGVPGQLFQGGYDVDWNAILDGNGIPVIELHHIKDPAAKQIALVAIFMGLMSALEARNPNADGSDTDELLARLKLDETGGIFDDTEVGRILAHRFTNVRGKGLSITLAQQGNTEKLHGDVTSNLENIWGMGLNRIEDLTFFANRVGVTVEKVRELLSARPGRGFYYGGDMPNGPIRIRIEDPRKLKKTKSGVVLGPERLLDIGLDSDPYADRTRLAARKWLETEPLGNDVVAWAELNAVLLAKKRGPAPIAPDMAAKLAAMQGKAATKRDAAISMVAKAVIAARGFLGSKEEQVIRNHMLAIAHGQTPPQVDVTELGLPTSRYNPLKDLLNDKLIIGRIDIGAYEGALGIKIGGAYAHEQLTNAEGKEIEALAKLKDILVADDDQPLAATSIDSGVAELSKLTGGSKELTNRAKERIEEGLQRSLTEAEQDRLGEIVVALGSARPVGSVGNPLGLYQLQQKLQDSIANAALSKAVNISGWEKRFGEQYQGNTVGQQLESVKAAEEAFLADLEESLKVPPMDVYFAQDLIRTTPRPGGRGLDNVVGFWLRKDNIQGEMADDLERAYGRGLPDLRLVKFIVRGDRERKKKWKTLMADRIFMSDRFPLEGFVSQALAEDIDIIYKGLEKIDLERRALDPTTSGRNGQDND